MVKKKILVLLLAFSFVLPFGTSIMSFLLKNNTVEELIVNIINSSEEESKGEEKSEQEKEKHIAFLVFSPFNENVISSLQFNGFLISYLLMGETDFPHPPPRVS
jgi:hypothetical protein